jgi:phage tail sheath protein FI
VKINDQENKVLNQFGVNALRNLPVFGSVSWGARTLLGADKQASEWKYIPVRRLALYIEQSLFDGLTWVVFEPNDEPLWAQIRLNVGAFMQNLFRQGAFQGKTPREAYLVKCDSETTTQGHRSRHRQHHRRLCPGEAGRVRHLKDPAIGWPVRSLRRL